MTTTADDTFVGGSEDASQRWTYDPWRERPRTAAFAAAVALALCGVVVIAHEPFLVAAGLCLFCIASFAPALAPVDCRFDEGGVARRGLGAWERRTWGAIRRIDALPAGLLVSPYAKRHLLDGARALTLPMPAEHRERLAALVRAKWEAAHERA